VTFRTRSTLLRPRRPTAANHGESLDELRRLRILIDRRDTPAHLTNAAASLHANGDRADLLRSHPAKAGKR